MVNSLHIVNNVHLFPVKDLFITAGQGNKVSQWCNIHTDGTKEELSQAHIDHLTSSKEYSKRLLGKIKVQKRTNLNKSPSKASQHEPYYDLSVNMTWSQCVICQTKWGGWSFSFLSHATIWVTSSRPCRTPQMVWVKSRSFHLMWWTL